jgi:hypothetical protein
MSSRGEGERQARGDGYGQRRHRGGVAAQRGDEVGRREADVGERQEDGDRRGALVGAGQALGLAQPADEDQPVAGPERGGREQDARLRRVGEHERREGQRRRAQREPAEGGEHGPARLDAPGQ